MEVAVLAFTVGIVFFFGLFLPAIAWGTFYDRFLRKPEQRLPDLGDHANLLLARGPRPPQAQPQPPEHH